MSEPIIEFQARPEIEQFRAIWFMIANAERAFGLATDNALPFSARMEAILQAAMMRPDAIDADVYQAIYYLRNVGTTSTAERNC